MSQRHVYKCDRCGTEQETDDQMWNVGIEVRSLDSHRASYDQPRHTAEWCRTCVNKVRLLDSAIAQYQKDEAARKGQPPPADPPSFEEMLRGIVQEEIEAARNQ